MAAMEAALGALGGPYPEETLLEVYKLEWKAVELRRQRLRKSWTLSQHIECFDEEELRFWFAKRRLKRQERQRAEDKARRQKEHERAEALAKKTEENDRRRAAASARKKDLEVKEQAKAKARRETKEKAEVKARRKAERREAKEKAEAKARRKAEREAEEKAKRKTRRAQQAVISVETAEHEGVAPQKKQKQPKTQTQSKPKNKPSKTEKKRTSGPAKPVSLVETDAESAVSAESAESAESAVEYPAELADYDSPPPKLPADDLLNMLSQDNGSDSEIEDEPSMTSLILPVARNSPKKASPKKKKKVPSAQKRFGRTRDGQPLDFNFTNAEAKRVKAAQQDEDAEAKRVKAAQQDEDAEADESDVEPSQPPKKALKRRKDVAKARREALSTAGVAAVSKPKTAAVAAQPAAKKQPAATAQKSSATSAEAEQESNEEEARTAKRKKPLASAKQAETAKEKRTTKLDKMTGIKQALANAEMLTRLSKMQDVKTPKVPSKRVKKTAMKTAMQTLAAKRAEFREAIHRTPVDDPERPPQDDKRAEVNASITSIQSGDAASDASQDSPEKQPARKRKREREAPERQDADTVTPAKKLQFHEITRRLAKSPMPRFLRTPNPRIARSPMIPSALTTPQRRASPAPVSRGASEATAVVTGTPLTKAAAVAYSSRRMTSKPPSARKKAMKERFGLPMSGGGSAPSGAAAGGFSMFDAFVNSGGGSAIPRLKTSTSFRPASPTV